MEHSWACTHKRNSTTNN